MFKSVEVKLLRGREKRNPQSKTGIAFNLPHALGTLLSSILKGLFTEPGSSANASVPGYGATEQLGQTHLEGKQRQAGRRWGGSDGAACTLTCS